MGYQAEKKKIEQKLKRGIKMLLILLKLKKMVFQSILIFLVMVALIQNVYMSTH